MEQEGKPRRGDKEVRENGGKLERNGVNEKGKERFSRKQI